MTNFNAMDNIQKACSLSKYWKLKTNEKLLLLHLDIVTAATIRAHCLIAAEVAGPTLIPGPQTGALPAPPPRVGPCIEVTIILD